MTAKPLHILFINVFYAPTTFGGATHVVEQVSSSLVSAHGVRVTVVSAMSRPEFAPYAALKVEARGIVNYMINMPAGRAVQEMYCNPLVAERIDAIVDDVRPDLVNVHCVQEIGANIISSMKRRGLPVILSVHDFWWLCERQFMIRADGAYCGQDPVRVEGCSACVPDMAASRIRHNFLLEQAASADLVTYPSEFARDLCERSGLAPGKGVLWRNGIVPPGPDFFERQHDRRCKDPTVTFAYVGGPTPIKGWPIIQDAFRDLGRNDLNGYLVDASLGGTWYPRQSYAGMKGSWTVHPRYSGETLDEFYAKVDVLLFLSQWKETFGLTIREALSRGVLVIQTDAGGTVEHGQLDLVRRLQIGDGPDRLRKEVERILDNPSGAHVEPVRVRSFPEQADELLSLIATRVTGTAGG